MKLLTSIAAIVSLAAAGQVYHTPDVFQHLEFQQQPLFQFHQFPEHEQFQIQTQNDVKPIHEVQIEPQPIQHVQLPHQPVHHQPVHHQPVVHHQPIQHFQPQAEAEQHHGFSFKGFESFQAQQPHQSTPQVHQTHQVHQPKVHIAPQVHQSRLQAQSSHQGLQDQRHGQGHQEGLDKVAKIINHQHDTDGHNYQYMYETENGIKIQEVGSTAGKGSQAQGAYSYTGDDGQVYTVTYTADENGFHAQGAHLPTPPPMPEEIARSIEANARDAANGIVDDGQYQAHHHHQGQQQQQQNHQQHQDFQQNGYQQRHNFGQSSLNSEY